MKKVNLELIIGLETGVVVAALEALEMTMKEAEGRNLHPMSKMYCDIAERLRGKLQDAVDNAYP